MASLSAAISARSPVRPKASATTRQIGQRTKAAPDGKIRQEILQGKIGQDGQVSNVIES
jgi:hypothetical protein